MLMPISDSLRGRATTLQCGRGIIALLIGLARHRVLAGFLIAILTIATSTEAQEPRSRLEVLGLDWLPAQIAPVVKTVSSSDTVRVPGEPFAFHAWLENTDLIVALDENENGKVDQIDDCYVIDLDHDTNPGFDRVVDWQDLDQDGKADRQSLFSVYPPPGRNLTEFVIEARDDGRSHRGFWSLDRWQYSQHANQWECDFSGDQFFTAIRFDEERGVFEPYAECPFAFYDPDEDGWTEEVIRFAGNSATNPASIRWSFDTDNDGGWPTEPPRLGEPKSDTGALLPQLPYDYDLSVTADGGEAFAPDLLDTLELRNGTPLAILAWEKARAFASKADWRRALLVFDEVDANSDPADEQRRERWEGVIGEEVDGFPKIGGPGSGRMGKRYELRPAHRLGDPIDFTGPVSLYVSGIDGRIHLYGARAGWIEIDHDDDLLVDARLDMADQDGDGFFDTWYWDGDGDGVPEDTFQAFDPHATPLAMDWSAIARAEEGLRAASGGLDQYERFRADLERWLVAGKFVPLQ